MSLPCALLPRTLLPCALLPRALLPSMLLPCAAVKRTPPTERTIQSMTLNNPPDQPSAEQITTKNNFSYTSHDHHPLTGTPFPENNTAIPTTPATPTTLTTLASDPAANLAHLTCNPRYSHYSRYSRYSCYWEPFRLKLSPTTHHPRSHYPDSIVTLRCAQGLSPWARRCFAALS